MNILQMIALIVLFSLLILILGSLVRIYIIASSKNRKVTKENFEDSLEDLKLIKMLEDFEKNNNLDHLFKISRNPWNMSKPVWCLIKYGSPAIALILCFIIYTLTNDIMYSAMPAIFGVFGFAYPTSHYKGIVVDRERAWNKIQSYIWRIANSLETNDSKKVCVEMRDYFIKINETELAAGFEAFYELWPDSEDQIPEALEKLGEYYPFEIPKSLYFILLECWRNSSPAGERLNNFTKTCELKYQQLSNELLSKVPATATMYSLPFLLISVMAAIMFPAALQILEALGG